MEKEKSKIKVKENNMAHWVDNYSAAQQTIIKNNYLYRKCVESYSVLNGTTPRIYYYVGQSNCQAAPLVDIPADIAGDISGCYEIRYMQASNVDYHDYSLQQLKRRDADAAYGPKLRIGKLLRAYYGVPIIFVSCYKGGTGLADTGDSTLDFSTSASQEMYYQLKTKRTSVLNHLSVYGITPTEGGMIWIQGEEDMQSDAKSSAYQTNMENFISTWRTDIGHANAKFYLCKMTLPDPPYNTTWINRVRTAMDTIDTADTSVKAIETNTYSRYDSIHFDATGVEDFAQAVYTQLIL